MNRDQDLAQALSREESRLKRTQFALGATLVLGGSLWLAGFRQAEPAEVIRVRGIVVEDAQGKPRILIGAPIPETAGRVRKDAASGFVLLDDAGVDRLQIGNVGGPMMGGRVQPRIADAVGLMVCDSRGNERAGFGYLENGQVGWDLDCEGGEAIVAAVLPAQGMAGIIINATVEEGTPTRAMLATTKDGTSFRLSNANGSERAVLEVDIEFDAPATDVHLWWQEGKQARHDLGPLEGLQRLEVP